MRVQKNIVTKLNLFKQNLFYSPSGFTQDDALKIIQNLGCIQLDTLNVLTRSHNLIFLARMHHYQEEWYCKFYEEKKIVEGYTHALSILPTNEYIYLKPSQNIFKESMMKLDVQKVNLIFDIYEEVKKKAPLESRHLIGIDKKLKNNMNSTVEFNESVWKVTPIRWALDILWRSGLIIQTRDEKFNKVFYLPENWLPLYEDQEEKFQITLKETYQRYILLALNAMGIATISEISDYFRMNQEIVSGVLGNLMLSGEIKEVEVIGEIEKHFVKSHDVNLIESDLLKNEPEHSAFLSPFDNLIWNRKRMFKLFGFDFRLESYIPQERRKYGYFAMPILIRGRIIGTIDLKLERKLSTLVIKNVFWLNPSEKHEFVSDIFFNLKKLMCFVKADFLISDSVEGKLFISQMNL